MHYFDPRQSYRSTDEKGVHSRQNMEMNVLRQEYLQETRPGSMVPNMVVILSMDTIRTMLRDHPEYLGDTPAQPYEEMDEQAKQEHRNLLAELEHPDSFCSKFAAWIDAKRGE